MNRCHSFELDRVKEIVLQRKMFRLLDQEDMQCAGELSQETHFSCKELTMNDRYSTVEVIRIHDLHVIVVHPLLPF
jgi:hypothetical protein